MKWLFMVALFSPYAFGLKLGIENITPDLINQLQGHAIGLVTNQTGVDHHGRRTIDILREKGVPIKTIFAAEHGLKGTIHMEHSVQDEIDVKTGLPVISLYKNGSGCITAGHLDQIDIMLFDMQDVGMRHYTYISTLYQSMDAAAKAGKTIVVFDRPNLLGGVMEGPICEKVLHSFIGIASLPLRHGLTMGELAQFFNTRCLKKRADLTVVPLSGYDRAMEVARLVSPLSPNIKSIDSVRGYSFLGLLGEIRPFNVGVGTPHSFQLITLPADINVSQRAWDTLQDDLKQFGIHAKRYSYMCNKRKKAFHGLYVMCKDMQAVSGFKAFMHILTWTKEHHVPVTFSPTFDKAIGTHRIQAWYEKEDDEKQLMHGVKQDLHQFLNTNKDILLYETEPKVVRYQPHPLSFDTGHLCT